MKAYLIAGVKVDENFIKENLINIANDDKIISIDAGLEVLDKIGIEPDIILGDFDSIDSAFLDKYDKSKICRYNPKKDFSDTELAIEKAYKLGFKEIYILAGLGKRMDHSLSNVYLLAKYKKLGLDIVLLDEYNKIYIKDESFCIDKSRQYGSFVSFYPLYNKEDFKLSLRGFKYPLEERKIDLFINPSLCLSNEIMEEKAFVEFYNNMLLCIESRD